MICHGIIVLQLVIGTNVKAIECMRHGALDRYYGKHDLMNFV